MTRRDCCLCCCEAGNVQHLNDIPVLMEIGGTWITSNHRASIPIWWIAFRFICMLYLIFTAIITQAYVYVDSGYAIYFYFYQLTLWANLLAMISSIIKFISTVIAYKTNVVDLSDYIQHRTLYLLHKVMLWVSLPVLTQVTFNFWAFVYGTEYALTGFTGFDTINTHGISFVFMWVDFVLSQERFYYKNAIWSFGFALCYLLWSVVFEVVGLRDVNGDTYLYRPLDWSDNFQFALIAVAFTLVSIVGFASMHTAIKNLILMKGLGVSQLDIM